jgi:cbb3-type cytochrome oxidase subunit 3
MRLVLLGLIFLLILTLGNAFVYRRQKIELAQTPRPALQLQRSIPHDASNGFVWREIGAIAITVVLYGVFASAGRLRERRRIRRDRYG